MMEEAALTLCSLPRDILNRVWSLLKVPDLLQLYCTGDRVLSVVFQRVTLPPILFAARIHFIYGQLPSFVQTLGAFITHFELRVLKPLAELPEVTQRSLRALSPNLHTLILVTPEAEEMLTCVDRKELKALRLLAASFPPQIGLNRDPKLINLSLLFPKLETLVIDSRKETSSRFVTIDFCVIRSLPLTSLDLAYNEHIDDNILHLLPPSLKHLRLGGEARLAPPFPPLPPSLETFHWSRSCHHTSPSTEAFVRFPRKLTELSEDAGPESSGLTNELLPLLKVQKLTSPNLFFMTEATRVPPNLTELSARWIIQTPNFSLLNVFPNTITSLTLEFWHIDDRTIDLSQLPVSLRELMISCRTDRHGQPEGLAPPLPPNLTKYTTIASQSLEGNWPLGLKTLSVGGASNYRKHPLTLPLALTSLSLRKLWDYDLLTLPDTLTQLWFEKLEVTGSTDDLKFPPALIKLTATSTLLTAGMINALPTTLQVLKATTGFAPFVLDVAAVVWPPSLCELSLSSYEGSPTLQDISSLPRTLKIFESHFVIPGDSVSALPAGLEKLEFEFVGDLRVHIRNLPRRLTTLFVHGGDLEPESAPYLPRTLTHIILNSFEAPHPHLLPLGLYYILEMSQRPRRAQYHGPYHAKTRKLIGPDCLKTYPPDDPKPFEPHQKGCVVS